MKRFEFSPDGFQNCMYCQLKEAPDGDWVDADEALKRIAELTAQRDEARAFIREFSDANYSTVEHLQCEAVDLVKQWDGEGE